MLRGSKRSGVGGFGYNPLQKEMCMLAYYCALCHIEQEKGSEEDNEGDGGDGVVAGGN